MPKSLNDFIAATRTGLANTSHFAVLFRKPKVVPSQKYSSEEIEKVFMFCESTTLPGMSYSSTPTRTFGEVVEMPYDRLFDNVTLNFLVDKDMKVKMFFDEWMAGIQNPYTRQFNYYSDYTTDLEIEMYDKTSNIKYKVTMYEAYPKSMGPIEVSSASTDVMRVSISFQFKYWTSQAMQNLDGENDGFGPRSLLDRIFAVPNKIWNSYVNFKDLF